MSVGTDDGGIGDGAECSCAQAPSRATPRAAPRTAPRTARDGTATRAPRTLTGGSLRRECPGYWSDHLTTFRCVPSVGVMPLQPVSRRSVPDEIFEQVLGEVVSGALGPGEALPSERRLAEVLGVSRPAVREALQRMAQTRLVEVRHGGATTVRDFRRHAGLDLLPSLLVRGGSVDVPVVRSVVEARLLIGPGVAALAAGRRNADQLARLSATVAAY